MRAHCGRIGKLTAGVVAFLIGLGFMACGGGGGGGGSAGGVSYEGLTTPAAIDASSAAPISAGAAITAGSSNAGILARTSNQQVSHTGAPLIGQVALAILNFESINRVAPRAHAIVPVSESLPGPCGGLVQANGSVDDQTGNFSLAMSFNSYCDAGVTLGGQVDTSGRVTGLFDADITMTGSQLACRENAELITYLWQDFTFTYDASSSSQSYTVDGRFFHPSYGYVNVSTLSTLWVYDPNMFPSTGSIKIVEDDANPDSATLTAISASQYRLDIDYGNDGTIDETRTESWSGT